MCETLLKAGADVKVKRRDGKSALQLAIVSGKDRSFEMVVALLEAKADVAVITEDGASALTWRLLRTVLGASRSSRNFWRLELM